VTWFLLNQFLNYIVIRVKIVSTQIVSIRFFVGKYVLFIAMVVGIRVVQVKPKVILFFGDSLTAGYGLSPEEAFPALSEKELIKNGKNVKAVNGGLSGETSAGGLRALTGYFVSRLMFLC
jgi:hypothetical protein